MAFDRGAPLVVLVVAVFAASLGLDALLDLLTGRFVRAGQGATAIES
jgi:hypothetical protein